MVGIRAQPKAFPKSSWDNPDGVAVLNAVGRLPRYWYGPTSLPLSGLAELGAWLENLLLQSPTRRGLLRLLAALCVNGYTPRVTGLGVAAGSFDDPGERTAAILVRLAQGRWTPDGSSPNP